MNLKDTLLTAAFGLIMSALSAQTADIRSANFDEKGESAAPPQPGYRITLITQPGARAYGSGANAINDRGQVTGDLYGFGTGLPPYPSTGFPVPVGQFYGHAFLYSNGQVTDLGAIGSYFSSGIAINNHGQVVGATTTTYDDSFFVHPFLSTGGGKMVDLGNLGDDFDTGAALGINDAEIIVGYSPYPHRGVPGLQLPRRSNPRPRFGERERCRRYQPVQSNRRHPLHGQLQP